MRTFLKFLGTGGCLVAIVMAILGTGFDPVSAPQQAVVGLYYTVAALGAVLAAVSFSGAAILDAIAAHQQATLAKLDALTRR